MADKVIELEQPLDKEVRQTAEYYAKLHKAMYDAHIKVGFTKAQALELVCTADPE